MSYSVHYYDAEGRPQLEDTVSLEAAIERAEQLRNEAGFDQVRLFRELHTEVHTEVHTYYRVVVVDDDQTTEVGAASYPQAPYADAPAPYADAPPPVEQPPVQPPAQPPVQPPGPSAPHDVPRPGPRPLPSPPQFWTQAEPAEYEGPDASDSPEEPLYESKLPSFLHRNG